MSGGFDFDGSSDYMLNDSASGIYNNVNQSIVFCFKPNFATNKNQKYDLYSDDSNDYRIFKRNNANSNSLFIALGGTEVETIAESTYSPYWNSYGTNVLVVAGTTSNTDVWLNGFKILDADNTAWSPANPSAIYLGVNDAIANFYDGKIFHFSTYDFKMTPIQMQTITNDLKLRYSK